MRLGRWLNGQAWIHARKHVKDRVWDTVRPRLWLPIHRAVGKPGELPFPFTVEEVRAWWLKKRRKKKGKRNALRRRR